MRWVGVVLGSACWWAVAWFAGSFLGAAGYWGWFPDGREAGGAAGYVLLVGPPLAIGAWMAGGNRLHRGALGCAVVMAAGVSVGILTIAMTFGELANPACGCDIGLVIVAPIYLLVAAAGTALCLAAGGYGRRVLTRGT